MVLDGIDRDKRSNDVKLIEKQHFIILSAIVPKTLDIF